ncbi:hypothetical protein DRP05_04205 [Archaeoglobales archaeon]|nr:MAG: hypothetical protein DRP05_04205 [Archaeoglobales archaeon]
MFWRKKKNRSDVLKLLSPKAHKEEVDRCIAAPELVEVEKGLISINGRPMIISYIAAYPAKVYEGWIADELVWKPFNIDVVQFVEPMPEERIVAELNRKITQLEAKLAEMRGKGRIDTQSIEQELEYFYRYRELLTARRTKLFTMSTYFAVSADRNAVEDAFVDFSKRMKAKGAQLKRIRYRMLDAFKAFLPENRDLLKRKVLVDSDAASSCFFFSFPKIMHENGVLYGFDAATRSPVIIDRFRFAGHNEVVVGKIGSGKSFFVKLEMLRWMLNDSNIKIFLVDPLGGFADLAAVLGAQRVVVGKATMNPLDIIVPEGVSARDVLREKLMSLMEFFSTFFEEEIGSPVDKTESGVLRKAILKAYSKKGYGRAIIGDVISELENVAESEEERSAASRLKAALNAFTSELSMFNGQTDIEIYGRAVYFDFSQVEGVIRSPLLLHAVLTWISSRVRGEGGKKIVVIDEAHYFMRYKQIRAFLEREIRHSRHYKVGYTLVSQSFAEFAEHEEGKVMLSNANIVVIFRLDSMPEEIRRMLGISKFGEQFVKEAAQGKVAGYSSALLVLPGENSYHINVLASPAEIEFLGSAGRGV